MLVSGIMLQIYEFMFLYGDAGVIWLWCGDSTDENMQIVQMEILSKTNVQ